MVCREAIDLEVVMSIIRAFAHSHALNDVPFMRRKKQESRRILSYACCFTNERAREGRALGEGKLYGRCRYAT